MQRDKRCADCGAMIGFTSTRCRPCAARHSAPRMLASKRARFNGFTTYRASQQRPYLEIVIPPLTSHDASTP
jgi:hypothetical protein